MIIYFTGTGNSKYCAKLLEAKLGDEVINSFEFIKENKKPDICSEKPLIFVCPTYSWQIPHVFRDLIKRSHFKGSKKAYFIMTCGSDIGNAERYNIELCSEIGLSHMGTLEVIMPENYIAMFQAPQKEEAREIIRNAIPVLEKAAELIKKEEKLPKKEDKAGDNLKSGFINKLFYPMFVKAKPYYAKETCIKCLKCVNICPLGNISLKDGKINWGDNCTQCMACMNYCPVEAIEYGNKSKGKVRYTCPEYK